MEIVSFLHKKQQKKTKKYKIYCIGKVFKPTFFAMLSMILMLTANLIINNFFLNITASLQSFVQSFVKLF